MLATPIPPYFTYFTLDKLGFGELLEFLFDAVEVVSIRLPYTNMPENFLHLHRLNHCMI